MSVCTHCGQDHKATGAVCRAVPAKPAAPMPAAQKTLFGMPSAPMPQASKTPVARTTGHATTPRVSATRLPAPAKPPLPRLPTAEEARENPNLVISLEVTPAPHPPAAPPPNRPVSSGPARAASPAPSRPANSAPSRPAGASPSSLAETPRVVARDAGDAADFGPTVDLPPVAESGLELVVGEDTPTDLPAPGKGPRFALPDAPVAEDPDASGDTSRRTAGGFGQRLGRDLKSIIELIGWSATSYFSKPAAFFVLALVLVLPASFMQSCLATALVPTPPSNVLARGATTAHFEQRKAELAKRIQEAQARGEMDSESAVALAALTAAGVTPAASSKVEVGDDTSWLRFRLILLIQGLLVLGLAFPLACGFLALAYFDRESGAAMPGLADVWPILVARAQPLLAVLLPAALLVGLGYALFIVPGLVLSVLFLFLPHVVIFEKKAGRSAFGRSLALVREDAIRTTLAFLCFALATAVVILGAEQLLPTDASRAVAFLHFLVCDLLAVAVLPIPALVLARLYLELRAPKADAEVLSRAARS